MSSDVVTRPLPVNRAVHRWKLPKSFGPRTLKIVMPWLENFWKTNQRFPFPDEWMEKFELTHEGVDAILVNPAFKRSCKVRGIVPNFWERGLNERQVTTIALLSNLGDGRSIDQKLHSIGVTQTELDGWYSIPEFQQTLEARVTENLGNFKTEAVSSLTRNVKRGNQRAIEYSLKLMGVDESPEVINLKRAMQLMIDSVQRHVKDPEVLAQIADDLKDLV